MLQRDHRFSFSLGKALLFLLLIAAAVVATWSHPFNTAVAEPGDPLDAAAAKDDPQEARRDNPRRRTRRPTIDASRLELDSVAVKKFSAIVDLLAAEEWTEALELLQRLGEEHGDRLVPAGKNRYISARLHGQQLIAKLPRDVLKRYRQAVDPQAATWWEAAKPYRDEQKLLQIVRDAFASSWGDDAAMLLAEIAFERGDVAAAKGWYRSLLPPDLEIVRDVAAEMQYPDTSFPIPEIVAKIILCEIFAEQYTQAVDRLNEFAKLFPDATGHLAGRNGPLAATLTALLREQRSVSPKSFQAEYSTFAANAQRQSSTAERVVIGAVQWSVDLPTVSIIAPPLPTFGQMFESIRPTSRDLGPAAVVHPVVANGIVYFCTDAAISAVKLRGKSGQAEPAWDETGSFEIYRLPKELYQGTQSNRTIHGVPAYTVTVHNGRLFARLGVRGHRSFLVCLNVGRGQGKLEWELSDTGIGELNDTFRFDGTPVAVDDRIFVPLRRLAPQQENYVACLSATDGRVIWRRRVSQGGPAVTVDAEEEPIQLVTVADGRVFVNTNNGVVAALSITDGSLLWAYTYPQTETENPAEFARRRKNGPNPCVVSNGLVYVAPFDCDATLCLTAEVGSLKWASTDTRQSAFSVIGVENGCVAITGERLWLLDGLTGEQRFATAHIGRERDGYGRGTIAGGCLYFPTLSDLRVFDITHPAKMQETVLQDVDLGQENDERSIGGGNVVVASGFVLVATPQQLLAYTDAGALRQSRGPIVVQNPDDPVARFELALAEQQDDDLAAATESLRNALSLCRNETLYHGELLSPVVRKTLCDVLQSRAQRAFEAGETSSGCELLRDAVAHCDNITRCNRLRLVLAEQLHVAGNHAAAIAELDAVLAIEAQFSRKSQFAGMHEVVDVVDTVTAAPPMESLFTAGDNDGPAEIAQDGLGDTAGLSRGDDSPSASAGGFRADVRATQLYDRWLAAGDDRVHSANDNGGKDEANGSKVDAQQPNTPPSGANSSNASKSQSAPFATAAMARLVKKKLRIEQLIASGDSATAMLQWQTLPRLPQFDATRTSLARALVKGERFRDLLKLVADEHRIASAERKPGVLAMAADALSQNTKTASLAAHLNSLAGHLDNQRATGAGEAAGAETAVGPETAVDADAAVGADSAVDNESNDSPSRDDATIVRADSTDSTDETLWRHWSVPLADECRWMLPVSLTVAQSTNADQTAAVLSEAGPADTRQSGRDNQASPDSSAGTYLLLNSGDLRLVEMSNGSTVWTRLVDRDWTWGATSGLVACVAHAEEIRGYGVLTGELLWSRTFADVSTVDANASLGVTVVPSDKANASMFDLVAAANRGKSLNATTSKRNEAAPFRAVNAGGSPEQPVVEYRLVAGQVIRFSATGVHALSLETGRVDWSFTPASGIVCNQWAALPAQLAVTVRDSRELAILDLQSSGRMVPDVSTQHGHFWLGSPTALARRSWLAAVQPDLSVALIDMQVPAQLSKFAVGFSRSHAEPTLFTRGEALFAINDGDTLLRLSTEPGSVQWSVRFPRTTAAGHLVPQHIAADDQTVFVAANGFLQGFSREDGAKKFTQRLPTANGSWRCELRLGRVWLIPDSTDQPGDVLVCSSSMGESQQRLRLPVTLQRGVKAAWSNGAVVAASRRELTCWVPGRDRQRLAQR